MNRRIIAVFAVILSFHPAAAYAAEPAPNEVVMIPTGDPSEGRSAFIKLNCVACHAVRGDSELRAPWAANQGPTLREPGAKSGVGYLLDSIISPSHRIEGQEVFEGAELSHMGDYTHAMSVRELLDIVAYLNQ